MKFWWLFCSIALLVLCQTYVTIAQSSPTTVSQPVPPGDSSQPATETTPAANKPGDNTSSTENVTDTNNSGITTPTQTSSVPSKTSSGATKKSDTTNVDSKTSQATPSQTTPAPTKTDAPPTTASSEHTKTTTNNETVTTTTSSPTGAQSKTNSPQAPSQDSTSPSNTSSSKATVTTTPTNPTTTTVPPTISSNNASLVPDSTTTVTDKPTTHAEPSTTPETTKSSQPSEPSTQTPVNPNLTTQNVTDSNMPTKTSTATTTQESTTTSSSETTTANVTDKTTATPVKPSTQGQPETTQKPDTGSTVSPTTDDRHVFINEISVDKNGVFKQIEVQVPSEQDKSNYAVAVVKGPSLTSVKVIYLQNETDTYKKFMLLNLDNMVPISDGGMGFALYNLHTRNSTIIEGAPLDSNGLVDALVIGKKYEQIDGQLVDTLTPHMNPFVLDPSLYGTAKSICRCSQQFQRRTDMFALLDPSMGENNTNSCTAINTKQSSIELQLTGECSSFLYKNNTARDTDMMDKMVGTVVKEVNRKCQCGITKMHVKNTEGKCCRGSLNLKMTLRASTDDRVNNIKSSFNVFRKQTTEINVSGTAYPLDSKCFQRCCDSQDMNVQPQKDDTKDKNVRVTVAVIVTCLLVFLVILGVVIIYMKRKKKAVYQFRMSRLQEDEDDDQDEFIGGQDATFDMKP